jgi:hypothetical protein
MEEIFGVTWGLAGNELSHEQTIQRIVRAGFPIWKSDPTPHSPVLTMFAIVEGESGEYTRAWHMNVDRWPENADDTVPFQGPVKRYEQLPDLSYKLIPLGEHRDLEFMRVQSVDLGFMQRNKLMPSKTFVEMGGEAASDFIISLFDQYPELARADTAAKDAYDFWVAGGYDYGRWFAYKPGTESFHLKMTYGSKAVANWLVHSFVDKKMTLDWK